MMSLGGVENRPDPNLKGFNLNGGTKKHELGQHQVVQTDGSKSHKSKYPQDNPEKPLIDRESYRKSSLLGADIKAERGAETPQWTRSSSNMSQSTRPLPNIDPSKSDMGQSTPASSDLQQSKSNSSGMSKEAASPSQANLGSESEGLVQESRRGDLSAGGIDSKESNNTTAPTAEPSAQAARHAGQAQTMSSDQTQSAALDPQALSDPSSNPKNPEIASSPPNEAEPSAQAARHAGQAQTRSSDQTQSAALDSQALSDPSSNPENPEIASSSLNEAEPSAQETVVMPDENEHEEDETQQALDDTAFYAGAGVSGTGGVVSVVNASHQANVGTMGASTHSSQSDSLQLMVADVDQRIFSGLGGAFSSGALAFGAGASIIDVIENERLIKNSMHEVKRHLSQLEVREVLAFEAASRKDGVLPSEMSAQGLKDYLKHRCIKSLVLNTLKAGATGSFSFSAGLLGIGLFVPPAMPVMLPLALSILGIGAASTLLAAWVNARRLEQNLSALLEAPDVNALLDQKRTAAMQAHSYEEAAMQEERQAFAQETLLSRAAALFTGGILLTRAVSLSKVTLPIIGQITGGMLSFLYTFSIIPGALSNYARRQKKLRRMDTFLKSVAFPNITQRPYVFLGSSPWDQYLKDHVESISEELSLPSDDRTFPNLKKALNRPENGFLKDKYMLSCQKDQYEQALETFFQTHQERLFTAQERAEIDATDPSELNKAPGAVPALDRLTPAQQQRLKEAYHVEAVSQHAYSDTLGSGFSNLIKGVGSVAGLAFLFPPAAPVLLAVAGIGGLIGSGITLVTARRERERFRRKAQEAYNSQRAG